MTINPEIRDQAYQFFIEEAPELLQQIEIGLLTLRQERSTAKVHEIMRAAHSIKGGAASVELDEIKTLAHRLEDIFKVFYQEAVEIDTELESLLLQAYDCLRLPLTEQVTRGSFDVETALATAEPIFTELEERLGDYLQAGDNFIPSSADLGIDVVSSIFEVDVAQGLERLQNVIDNPQDYEVAGELRAQAEVFGGFAELLNLPGFGAIAQTALAALEAHPQRVLVIARLMLADCWQAREVVLGGDRTSGGSPSQELVALSERDIEHSEPEIASESLLNQAPGLDDVFGTPQASLDDLFGSPQLGLEASQENVASVDHDSWDETTSPKNLEIEDDAPTLETAAESVQAIFEQLPLADDLADLTAESSPEHRAKPPRSQKPPQTNPTPHLSVRVDLNRLEKMNNLVGELAINRNSLALRNDQLQGTVKELLNRFLRFQNKTENLRTHSEQMLVAPERFTHASSTQTKNQPSGWSDRSSFDSLEMDNYGEVYPLLQNLLEEVIQLEESVDDLVLYARQSDQTIGQQRQMLTDLRNELMWARMLPLGEVLNRFPRVLRDLSTKYGKSVNLKLTGTEVLVDKAALEKLYDPLLHLLRNAFDHGIEKSETRQQQGKPTTGTIEIKAYHQGNKTVIEVKDDGKGLNIDKISRRAVEMGLLTPQKLAAMSKDQIANLIFEPGFSTASQVSELSGRGVGLDVVRLQLQSLKGIITVASSPGRGTTFTLRLPLTLTISKLLVCLTGSNAYALPADSIEDIVVPQPQQLKHSGEKQFLCWQNQIVPIYSLATMLEYGCPLPEALPNKVLSAVPMRQDHTSPLLLLRQGEQLFALEVENLINEQELVIKPFGGAIAPPSYTLGCTILGDGTLIPVIDGTALIEMVLSGTSTGLSTPIATPQSVKQASTVLLVDDSAALRRTLALTLQKAGYRVLQAKDGRDALEQLQQSSAVQLVICDIEMPNMNGFEFLSVRRQDQDLVQIPVAMLTSRSNNKHRQLATHLGANAYFTKPYIEQEFLQAIQNLIKPNQSQVPSLN